ncbi:hypothetical protein BHE74_00011180 [Ensete ventricosum]|nr:hypothetical protein BHE74_00011180 [Ensete ventricosum]RZR97407.1 hypothetical protein BHM03_00026582 [Ensete ventricosum]
MQPLACVSYTGQATAGQGAYAPRLAHSTDALCYSLSAGRYTLSAASLLAAQQCSGKEWSGPALAAQLGGCLAPRNSVSCLAPTCRLAYLPSASAEQRFRTYAQAIKVNQANKEPSLSTTPRYRSKSVLYPSLPAPWTFLKR